MSVLETPRILFKGEMTFDPITTNNYDTYYDEDTDKPIYPTQHDKVQAFRTQSIAAVNADGSWNPDGTHRSTFYDSAISGVDLGAGVTTDDKFVASAANFTGMLVDLEPYGSISSQLFFNTMTFGVDGGYRIQCRRKSRFTARYINFNRNSSNKMIAGIASVVWQTSFAKQDGVRIDAFDSAALKALETSLKQDDVLGLTVRFVVYRTIYYDDPTLTNTSPETPVAGQKLMDKLTGGGFQPNPARTKSVGVIGLWRKGEPFHEPGDRALLSTANLPPGVAAVGTAYARVTQKSLTLDLSNSIPEVTPDLQKQDLGTLDVVAVDAAGVPATIASLPFAQYDRAAYEKSSGIVTFALAAGQADSIANKNLQLRQSTGGKVLANEVALRAIPIAPNTYVDEGHGSSISFQVYKHGMPVNAKTPIVLYQMSADGGSIVNTFNLQTDASGVLTYAVGVTPAGLIPFVPVPDSSLPVPSNGINTQVYTYAYIRTLAADAATGALPPTWDNVYARVLANWNAMAPCMDNWLMLDNPAQVKSYAAVLKRLTDPANLEDYLFMPVTRDMTAGGRKLLYKFLDAPPDSVVAHLAAAPQEVNYGTLSRSMRRGT